MKRKAEFRVGVGASSILMILVVLALTALSLLSLGAANFNASLGKRTLEMTLAYYEAAADVQRTLAAIDEETSSEALVRDQVRDRFVTPFFGDRVTIVSLTGEAFSFTVDAGSQREIAVEGTIAMDKAERMILTRHTLIQTAPTEEAPALNLMMP